MPEPTILEAPPAEDLRGSAEVVHEAPEPRGAASDAPGPLFPADEAGGLRERWMAVQSAFVDEPRRAVQEADALVMQTVQRLEEVFRNERTGLESRWSQGGEASTEDLRQALRRYRSFFDRLLSV